MKKFNIHVTFFINVFFLLGGLQSFAQKKDFFFGTKAVYGNTKNNFYMLKYYKKVSPTLFLLKISLLSHNTAKLVGLFVRF